MTAEGTQVAGPARTASAAPRVEYLLLSDVHLTQVLESPIRGWWAYKDPRARQDLELIELLEQVDAMRPDAFALASKFSRTFSNFSESRFSSPIIALDWFAARLISEIIFSRSCLSRSSFSFRMAMSSA